MRASWTDLVVPVAVMLGSIALGVFVFAYLG